MKTPLQKAIGTALSNLIWCYGAGTLDAWSLSLDGTGLFTTRKQYGIGRYKFRVQTFGDRVRVFARGHQRTIKLSSRPN